MAAPSAPTIDSIVQEALAKANSMEKFARAKAEWMEEIKRDMQSRRDWKVLEKSAAVLTAQFSTSATLPVDYARFIKVTLHEGETGVAQAGSASSITLASSEDITQDAAEGALIFLTSGTGAGQFARITAYNPGTKVATSSWGTAPVNGTGYLVATSEKELPYVPWEDISISGTPGRPSAFSLYDQALHFDRPLDDSAIRVIVLHYYLDINLVDLTSVKLTELYRVWRNVFYLGILYRAYIEKGDARMGSAFTQYENAVLRAAILDERARRGKRTVRMQAAGGGLPRRHGLA
jgi:hypothetical protein